MFTAQLEIDGRILERLQIHVCSATEAMLRGAKYLQPIPAGRLHIRHNGQYRAELRTDPAGRVYAESHADGCELFEVLTEADALRPLYDEFCSVFN